MNKKDLKFYEAPAFEEVELELQGVLCASGDPENVDAEEMGSGERD